MFKWGVRLSTKGPPHPAPVHRADWNSRGREVSPTADEGQLRTQSRDSQSPPCLNNTEVLVKVQIVLHSTHL